MLRNAQNQVVGGVNSAISAGLTDVRQAADLAMHGNFSGALEKLASGPFDVMGSLASSFGLSSGSKLTKANSDPTNSLSGALARSDPLTNFDWYCVLPDVTPLGGSTKELPWYFVEEATPPFRSFDQRAIYRQGRNKHYPAMYSVDTLRLAIYADISNKAQDYLQAWEGAIVSNTSSSDSELKGGGYGRPIDYKKTIRIFLVNPMKQQVLQLEYIECWPTSRDAYTLESGSSGRLVNNVTFSVGDVFVTLYGASKMSSSVLSNPSSMGSYFTSAIVNKLF